jgi:hypothetical protein
MRSNDCDFECVGSLGGALGQSDLLYIHVQIANSVHCRRLPNGEALVVVIDDFGVLLRRHRSRLFGILGTNENPKSHVRHAHCRWRCVFSDLNEHVKVTCIALLSHAHSDHGHAIRAFTTECLTDTTDGGNGSFESSAIVAESLPLC